MYIRPNSEGVPPLRRIFTTALLALGMAGLIHAADAASAAPSAATPTGSAPSAPAASPATAATPAPAKADSGKAKPASAPAAAPAKKLSKKAKAAADSAARADSLKAVAAADSAKAAQAKADSVRAAAVADSLRADSTQKADARSKAAADSARIAAAADSAAADSATAKAKKRRRIGRETTVNTIDELKGKYRSPKKAMFMSLVVPGLGQAYVGQHWFNYARGAVYFMTDVALAYGWHYYVGVKQDREIKKYQAFADENWRQYKYEDSVELHKEKSKDLNPHRDAYCDAVQNQNSQKGVLLHTGCMDPEKSGEYPSFKNEYNDEALGADSVGRLRADFPNSQQFYELIGKENEFITGWLDAPAMKMGDTAWYAVDENGNVVLDAAKRQVLATTPAQQHYVAMRAQANDYARMQAWFLGGMVVNHIVSAVDAALTARYHNKALYQTETSWYDRLHLDSRIAWEGLAPVPSVTASFTF